MVLTSSICRRPRRRDLAVFSDIASLQSDPLRGREQQSLVEGVTTGGPEIKAHFVRTGCKHRQPFNYPGRKAQTLVMSNATITMGG